MSISRIVKTCMTNKPALVTALKMRYPVVLTPLRPVALTGYAARGQMVEIQLTEDFGFKRGADRNFEAVVTGSSERTIDDKWLDRLAEDYMAIKANTIMAEHNSEELDRTTLPDGSIQIRFKQTVNA